MDLDKCGTRGRNKYLVVRLLGKKLARNNHVCSGKGSGGEGEGEGEGEGWGRTSMARSRFLKASAELARAV